MQRQLPQKWVWAIKMGVVMAKIFGLAYSYLPLLLLPPLFEAVINPNSYSATKKVRLHFAPPPSTCSYSPDECSSTSLQFINQYSNKLPVASTQACCKLNFINICSQLLITIGVGTQFGLGGTKQPCMSCARAQQQFGLGDTIPPCPVHVHNRS